jgi:hypothetical protein
MPEVTNFRIPYRTIPNVRPPEGVKKQKLSASNMDAKGFCAL